MKKCRECGEEHPESAKFCYNCGLALEAIAPDKAPASRSGSLTGAKSSSTSSSASRTLSLEADELSRSISSGSLAARQSLRKADVLFVLDCTGSMRGEISAIREAIFSFADTIRTEKVRARVGLIEFRDRLNGEEHRVLNFDGDAFTSDPDLFRRQVSLLTATGGGDDPESSLDALLLATRQRFSDDAAKVIVLVTDAPPHIPDKEVRSVDELMAAIDKMGLNQLYMVINTRDSASLVYLRLLEKTRGLAFDLGQGDSFKEREEHFRATLMALGKTIGTATQAVV